MTKQLVRQMYGDDGQDGGGGGGVETDKGDCGGRVEGGGRRVCVGRGELNENRPPAPQPSDQDKCIHYVREYGETGAGWVPSMMD